jgi:rhodanese-related sulfurtransferase
MALSSRFQKLAADAKTRIKEITAKEASDQQKAGAMLFDVRETEDFAKEHATDAVHLSRGTIELKIEEKVPDTAARIICYCGGGSRSALAADNLQKMGYTNVVSMAGGFKSWKEQGLPIS